MSVDIVPKLRRLRAVGAVPEHGVIVIEWHFHADVATWRSDVDLASQAADEIERLRAELAKVRAEREEAWRKYLGEGWTDCAELAAEAADRDAREDDA